MLIGFDIFVVYCASVMAAPFMSELLQKSAFRLTASAETHVMSSKQMIIQPVKTPTISNNVFDNNPDVVISVWVLSF